MNNKPEAVAVGQEICEAVFGGNTEYLSAIAAIIDDALDRVRREQREEWLETLVTFDNLRSYFTEDEVSDFSLGLVVGRLRKLIRKGEVE